MIKNCSELVTHITQEISRHCDIAVLGMSGGADSTLVSILATLALGKDHVHSLHMPMNLTDRQTFNSRSWISATQLGIHKTLVSIEPIAQAITACTSSVVGSSLSLLNQGNARSRARMTLLYSLSTHLGETFKKRVRVLGTGNLSEDFIGYDTKGGDALGDFFPIGELFKSEVYQLLDHFLSLGMITEAMIDRVPSAGLWEGQTDESELGFSYNQMELSIRKMLDGTFSVAEGDHIDRFVYQRHLAHKHKHEAPLVISSRHLCD